MIRAIAQRLFSLPAAMFYCMAASSLYDALDSPPGIAALAALGAAALLPASIASWIVADARQRRRATSLDFGTFAYITWPLLVPIYLFSTRGWRALAPLGCFLLLYIAAIATSFLPSCL